MLILYFQYLEQCPAWRTEQTFLKLIHITLAIAISLPSKSGKFWLPGTPTHVPEWTSIPKVLCVCGHGWLSGCMSRSRSDGQPALGLHLLSSSIPALSLLSLRRSFLWGTSWASCLQCLLSGTTQPSKSYSWLFSSLCLFLHCMHSTTQKISGHCLII